VKQLASFLAVLHLLAWAATGAAQTPAVPSAARAASVADEEPLPRWDTFVFLGWRGSRIDDTEYSSNDWDARFAYGVTAGYYLTPNIKAEADISLTSPSRFYQYEPVQVQGASYPFFARSDHRVVTASFGGTLIYQFFENASFHPFLGAGAGVITIRERISTDRQTQVFQRGPNIPPEVIVITQPSTRSHTDHHGRGLLIAGFKAYPGERVFFRTDVQWTVGSGRTRDVSLRIGMGWDF
jgi:hypothetical protein